MKSTTTRNIHVALPVSGYSRLRSEARRQHEPATQLVKLAVEQWLGERDKQALYEEIAAYATEMAGTDADLDDDLAEPRSVSGA